VPFQLPAVCGKILGFHARSGGHLDALGTYVKTVWQCSNLLFSACRFIYFPFVVLRVHICSPPLVILTGRGLPSQNYMVAESYRDRKEVFIQYIAKGKNESARASTCLTQRSDRTRRTNPRKDATEIHPSRTHQHCYSGPSKYFREGRQLPYARC
jgi:hypothetical protein